jgi:hypothetical protein
MEVHLLRERMSPSVCLSMSLCLSPYLSLSLCSLTLSPFILSLQSKEVEYLSEKG